MSKSIQDILNEQRNISEVFKKTDGMINRISRNAIDYATHDLILRSPGNDLLDFYDKQNELLGKDNRAYSAIPPSVVYHYRFEHEYPQELFDKRLNYGVNSYLRDRLKSYHHTHDSTYWGQVRTKRYNWLVDTPHEEIIFNYKSHLLEFLCEKFGQSAIYYDLGVNNANGQLKEQNMKFEKMFWRGNLRGWSVIAVPK